MPPAADTPYELDRALSTTRVGDGTYEVVVTDDWNTPNGTANGGYTLALVLHAVLEESSKPDPLTVSITYFRPPTAGDAIVTVRALREGRRISTYAATLEQDGVGIAHAVVTLHDADATGDAQHTPHLAPSIPPPDECIDAMGPLAGGMMPIVDRFDYRHAAVPGWFSGQPSGDPTALYWARPKDRRPIDALAAAVLVDAYPPVTAEVGMVPSATIVLTVHFRRRPATSWALTHIVNRHVIDGFHDEDVELWDENGRLIVESRQLAIL